MADMTVKQLADKLQTNKTKIFRTLKALDIEPHKDNGTFRLNETEQKRVADAIGDTQQTQHTGDSELVAVLKAQVAAQNEEIQRLHQALDQEQQLHLAEQQKVKLLEATPKHWWQRLFKEQS